MLFGYIIPDQATLDDAQKLRFRSVYCGLCRTLKHRHGLLGTSTLSYDLTFLSLLLSALYETEELHGEERCLAHPLKKHSFSVSAPYEYAADMNLALAYHKCKDNWLDDRNILSAGEAALLRRGYKKVARLYPDKCAAIERWLDEIHLIEQKNVCSIDAPVNSTGNMLGELFCWRDDFWSESLRRIGEGLGRFIYLMDAYDDLEKDIQRNRYNPLKAYADNDDFEVMCKRSLTMMVADCTQEFEQLPIVQDVDLIRNVLYSGIWSRYTQINKKKENDSKGVK